MSIRRLGATFYLGGGDRLHSSQLSPPQDPKALCKLRAWASAPNDSIVSLAAFTSWALAASYGPADGSSFGLRRGSGPSQGEQVSQRQRIAYSPSHPASRVLRITNLARHKPKHERHDARGAEPCPSTAATAPNISILHVHCAYPPNNALPVVMTLYRAERSYHTGWGVLPPLGSSRIKTDVLCSNPQRPCRLALRIFYSLKYLPASLPSVTSHSFP